VQEPSSIPVRLVGRSRDGERLHLEDQDGARYTLEIDENLRSTVAAPVLRLTSQSQLDLDPEDAPLTPKLIQQRIRSGESVEKIARERNVPVEQVERFAGPVLLERTHVANEAQKTLMRKGAPESHTLSALVEDRLGRRGIDPREVTWDAFKREDRRWSVTALFPSHEGHSQAVWVLDLARHSLAAENETARWLTGDERSPSEKVAPATAGIIPTKTQRETPRLKPVLDEQPPDNQAKRDGVSRRASVPSWDDIMFGAKRDED
jgi:hypothetical protein